MVRVFIYPTIDGVDDGQGGVRRVIEGQRRSLPAEGIELVGTPAEADVIACHIEIPEAWLKEYPDKVFVEHCHGLYWAEYEWPKWAKDVNHRVIEAIRVADAVTVPSEWVAAIVRRHTARNPVVIPHGLDLDEWTPRENVGYVLWDKTRPDAVCDPRWMNEVAALLPDVQFVSTFGEAAPNVTIVGKVTFEQAKGLIEGAAVYLATSRETFGIATLQALACGVPIVGFRWGAQPEILTHQVDSWLARPMDAEGLAEGIRWAIENRAEVSPECVRTAAGYPWETAARQYAQLYREAYERRQRPGPRTSIIVPAYKMEAYLGDCLESVAAQTDRDWECIVVDDASPDRGGEIARAFAKKDPRFRLVRNARNEYLSEARNVGIRAAKGRYILPLDADDMLKPRAVQLLADALDARRDLHIAYGAMYFVGADGKTPMNYRANDPGHSGWPLDFKFESQIAPPARAGARPQNLLPYCSMYRREVWELTGGYRRRLRTAEDADFWVRVSSYGFRPEKVTKSDTVVYRVRADSMSSQVEPPDWTRWFPWSRDKLRSPAGAVVAEGSLPIPSLEPPAVSVIIPVGPGHERLVADAVDSVDAQTLRHWECIVVNDSGRPLIELPSWVKVIESPKKGSVGRARNVGVMAAKARLFLPLDADDLLQPTALETMFEAFKRRPGTILYSDFWEDPAEPGEWSVFETPDWEAERLTRQEFTPVTQLTPVEAWRAVGGYPEDGPWEDWRFHLKLAKAGWCSARIAAPLFTYRKHSGRRAGEHYRDRDRNLAVVEGEFGEFLSGKESLMACGCKDQQRGTIFPANQTVYAAGIQGANMQLITYDGNREASSSFRGRVTGLRYRFARGESKYVDDRDVEHFLQLPGFHRGIAADSSQGPALVSANADANPTSDPWADIPATVRGTLAKGGITSGEGLRAASDEEVLAIKGIGAKLLEKLRVGFPHGSA